MTRPTSAGAGFPGPTTRRFRGFTVGAGNGDRDPRGGGCVATSRVCSPISDLPVVRFPTGQSSHPGGHGFEWACGLSQPRTSSAHSVQ